MEIPKENQKLCPNCGKIIDDRNLSLVVIHGMNKCALIVSHNSGATLKLDELERFTRKKTSFDLN